MEAASTPLARLVAGVGAAPIPGGPDREELPRLHTILSDPSHAEYVDVREEFAAAVGPWSRYEPDSTDLLSARLAIAARFGDEPRAHSRTAPVLSRIEWLVDAAPPPARPGLRRHVALMLPDQAGPAGPTLMAHTLRPLRWLVGVIGEEGAPLDEDGFLPPHLVAEGARELGWDAARLRDLVAAARELRLVRRFRKRLVLLAAARSVGGSSLALWHHLLDAIWQVGPDGNSRRDMSTTGLLLLSIADGTLSDPRTGEARLAAALQVFSHHDVWWDDWSHVLMSPRTLSYGERSARTATRARAVEGVPAARALALLGLERDVEGVWQTPPGMRAFAHAALARPLPRWFANRYP